jgi:hypothetical protein
MDSRFRGYDNNACDTDLGDAPNSLVPNIPAKSPLARRLGTPACDLPKLDVIPAKAGIHPIKILNTDKTFCSNQETASVKECRYPSHRPCGIDDELEWIPAFAGMTTMQVIQIWGMLQFPSSRIFPPRVLSQDDWALQLMISQNSMSFPQSRKSIISRI